MSKIHWVPRGRVKLHRKAEEVTSFTDANKKRFAMDEDSALGVWYRDVYHRVYDYYMELYEQCADPMKQTPFILGQLKMIEQDMIKLLGKLGVLLKGNPLVEDCDLEDMHLPPRPGGKLRPTPVETEPPAFEVAVMNSHRLKIFYYPDGSTRSKGRPYGQRGVEIRWGFLDTVTDNPDNLIHTINVTSSPRIIDFSPDDQGRPVDISLRWVNNRGIPGPWTPVRRHHIP
ncbi:MAG: hypothetical protein LBI58_04255 [Tannerellaceae bacterium]|jgi:hypothetical protein|nr:hypothetical protein [Tannerellaceae bacterium]